MEALSISDDVFLKVESLKWLPWIGERYLDIPKEKRLLIVGESHYHDRTEQSISFHNTITFTREIIEEIAIERCYYSTKIFQNLHKVLLRNDDFDTVKLWNLISFYNFVQRPMDTNRERPTVDDIINGWKVFAKLAEILRPKVCLFLGSSSANNLANGLIGTNYQANDVKWGDCINNCYAKTSEITHKDGEILKLIFIRHCSSMFSWDKWNRYLHTKITDHLLWLEEQTAGRKH
jgi:hypothetical protein